MQINSKVTNTPLNSMKAKHMVEGKVYSCEPENNKFGTGVFFIKPPIHSSIESFMRTYNESRTAKLLSVFTVFIPSASQKGNEKEFYLDLMSENTTVFECPNVSIEVKF